MGIEGAKAFQNGDSWKDFARGYSDEYLGTNRLKFDIIKTKEVILPESLLYMDSNANEGFIPKNAIIQLKKIIAGAGSAVPLRIADNLSVKYGGASADWQKVVGVIDSDKYRFDIHWYHNSGNGKDYPKFK